jgi:hypothetical protein
MASYGTYDDQPKDLVIADSGGISVPGTAAADTELVRIPINRGIKVDAIRMVAMTGGTADGPTVQVQKSLAGTGAASDIATQNVGTSADNTQFDLTVTQTDLAEGDVLIVSNAAGTAASTPKVTLNIEYRQDFD